MSKVGWIGIGSFREGSNGNKNFIISKNVEIFVDGKKVELGQFRTAKCFGAVDGVASLLSRGTINQEEADKRLQYIDEKRIKYDIVIPPPQD